MIRFLVVVFAAFVASNADAQESRLDAIQKSGTLRVCTPGDYQPFSLAKPDGSYEGTTSTSCNPWQRRSGSRWSS